MKTVYFVRHAKSSWDDPNAKDHDRILNSRGERDAPFMAKLLKGKGVNPDLLVCSTAARAQATALYFAKEFGIERSQIVLEPKIYEAYPEEIFEVLANLENKHSTIMIFGHNPSFTSVLNRFSEDYLANLPTCGIGQVIAATNSWSSFLEAGPRMNDLYFPKQYFS